ncbi:MAG: cysteine desulfurase [Alphaproteobacteria bacterium]|nr:cysteine desulfurase [Alphaproteobacteria bacterium]
MRPVYLDHHATTPCAPEVVDALVPWLRERFGNAASTHAHGSLAAAAADRAREQVAAAVGREADEVVFTSGATEADNLAVLGVAATHRVPGHLISTAVEHSAIRASLDHLEREGWRITRLQPGPDGRIVVDEALRALRPDTALVSVMTANHELGTLQPVRELARACRERGALFHTDAAQALGKVDLRGLDADLVSLSAHKAYGPQGIGALVVRRRGRPRVALQPRMLGGGQERGLRSGTLPVALVVGFGAAARLALRGLDEGEPARLAALRDDLLARLRALGGVHVHGTLTHRLPHSLNLRFDGVVAGELLSRIRGEVSCSVGSACASGRVAPSPVLKAIGLTDEEALGAVRLGLGRETTAQDVERAAAAFSHVVTELRAARVDRVAALR